MERTNDGELVARLSPTNRVEAFSDGVMAIAITLLVIEVRLPDDPVPGMSLLDQLTGLWPAYLAYLDSFVAIGVIWMCHHAFFGRIRHVDRGLRWANLVLLLAVAFIPFPTAVLAEHLAHGGTDAKVATAFYGLVLLLQCFGWLLMWRVVQRNPHLLEPGYDAKYARVQRRLGWAGVGIFTLSALIAILQPYAALTLFMLATIGYGITSDGIPIRRSARSLGR